MKDNKESDPSVRMSLVTFSNGAQIVQPMTGKLSDYQSTINNLPDPAGGTNWEEALRLGNSDNSQLSLRDNADTFVIFVTDGDPTFRLTRGENVKDHDLAPGGFSNGATQCDINDYAFAYSALGVFGTGSSNTSTNSAASLKRNYDYALQEAQEIVGQGKHFYGIGLSPDAPKLEQFMEDAGVSGNYKAADDGNELSAITKELAEQIKQTAGYTDVKIKDGITDLTSMMGKCPDVWSQVGGSGADPNGYFTYYRFGGEDNKYGTAENPIEWDPSEDGAGTASYNSTTGEVEWNLGENYVLEDGVTYRVSFNVWPSQEAYDILAGLNNGTIKYNQEDAAEGEQYLTDEQRNQIQSDGKGGYTLKTNVDNEEGNTDKGVHAFYKTCLYESGTITDKSDEQSKAYNTVDPMPLTKTEMKVQKKWDDGDYAKNRKPIDLIVREDGVVYATLHLSEEDALALDSSIWEEKIYIAPGLTVGGVDYEDGHEYSLDEAENGYQYEFETDTVHPMLVDSWTNISYGQDHAAALQAVNHMRGYLDVHKTVIASDGTTDISSSDPTEFSFKISLKDKDNNPIKYEDYPADDDTPVYDQISKNGITVNGYKYPIWYAKFNGKDRTQLTEQEQNAIEYGIIEDGEVFKINGEQTFQLFNIPSGTQYSIEELAEDGYHLQDSSTQTQSGTPEYNTGKEIVFVNQADEVPDEPHPTPPEDLPDIEHHKKIDYLGDGTANTDTTAASDTNAVSDLYRLYLDVSLKKSASNASIILVEDYSTSMDSNYMTSLSGDSKTRYEVMRQAMIGTGSSQGFIETAMEEGSGNQISIIRFSDKRYHRNTDGTEEASGSFLLQDWTSSKTAAEAAVDHEYPHITNGNYWEAGAYDNSRWTNYEAALQLAQTQINKISADRKDNPTYLIFLSDGLPTVYGNDQGGSVYWVQNQNSVLGKEVVQNLNVVIPKTMTAISTFKNANPNLIINSIGFAENMDEYIYADDMATYQNPYPKQYIYDSNGNKYRYRSVLEYLQNSGYASAKNGTELLDALNATLGRTPVTNVSVVDTLSQYVELYTNQPDFKVVKKAADNTETVYSVTYDANEKNYKVYDGDYELGRLILDGKKITLNFRDDLTYIDGDTYTVSFNVRASDEAYKAYEENLAKGDETGYKNSKGDASTDYGTNTSSSNRAGFYSNSDSGTELSYKFKNETYTESYEKPVIQVGKTKLEIEKVWDNAAGTAPDGIDELTLYIFVDGRSNRREITLKKSEGWKKTVDDLIPKKLADMTDEGGNPIYLTDETETVILDSQGNKIVKREYVPVAYELLEVTVPEEYTASYEYTATESADKTVFINMNSRYDSTTGEHIYYIEGSSVNEGGSAQVINKEIVKDISIVIKKTDNKPNSTNYLEGAVFRLEYRADSNAKWTNVSKTIVPELDEESKFTVPKTGITLSGLGDGQYRLYEVGAPNGYVITESYPVIFTVSDGAISSTDGTITGVTYAAAKETAPAEFTVPNEPGAALPSTGGRGTHLFYLLGIMLLGLAGAGYLLKMRRRNGV